MTMTAPRTMIKDMYYQLRRARSGKPHAWRYDELQSYVIEHEDELLGLLCSGELANDPQAIEELMHFGGHGGSLAFHDNTDWHGFMAKLRKRKAELPESVQESLDWLLEVHGW